MRQLGLMVAVAMIGVCAACGESHGTGDDAGTMITFDATLPDTGPGDLCGNGRLDPGERCDDGNTTPGDGCDAECVREPFCGDSEVTGDEACDDGNNRSGDGCRSDCRSDESCGNGIVDHAAGELCDGSPTCGADCMTVTGCGDGTVTEPEVCDDSNLERWDGCDAACQEEIVLVMSSLGLGGRSDGCDFNGDGSPDNAFARALGLLATAIGPLIEQQIESGDLILLLGMLGLDDRAGVNDDDFRIAWMVGEDADMDPDNNFGGAGQFRVTSDALGPDGAPLTSIQSQIVSNTLTGGPEDIPLPIGFLPLELRQGRIEGTTVPDAGELFRIDDGLLCGGIPLNLLALLGGFVGDMLETDPPCDGGDPATLLDLIIAGGEATANFGGMMFPLRFVATPPDLDLDGDGLEGFTITSDGPSGCQPVVTGCVDGDGMTIDGRGCFSDPRIGDGHSAAFTFSAIRGETLGISGGTGGPMPGM